MKRILSFAVLLISTFASAQTTYGRVQLFEGFTVETNRPYRYYALATQEGERLMLPKFLNAGVLEQTQDLVIVDGEVEAVFCTDMSRACPTGHFINIEKVIVDTGIVSARPFDVFDGVIKHFHGRFVETPGQTYDYYALVAKSGRRVGVPNQINAKLLSELGSNVVVHGHAQSFMCTDMSPACGPDMLTVLSSVVINLN